MINRITGVSAVNENGVVVIFVEASMPVFTHFRVESQNVILENDDSRLTRTYGRATIEALSSCGRATIQRLDIHGKDTGTYTLEVLHGL